MAVRVLSDRMSHFNSIEAYRQHVRERLGRLLPIFTSASVGDFSRNIDIPPDEDEFTELFVGTQLILEVVREQIDELKVLNASLEKKVEERTEALRKQTELYETLLRTQSEMGEGVVITEGPKIVYLNDALAALYGYTREELQALPSFIELIAPEFRAEVTERMRKRMAGQISEGSGETVVIGKNGSRINIEYSVRPMPGSAMQMISVVRDVTKKKQTEEVLRKERERAERAELARDVSETFLANMSHEMRTPMNAIMGFSGLLELAALSPEQKKYVEIIRRSGHNLLVIINDILDLSKLQAGKVRLEKKSFFIPEAIASAIDVIRPRAQEKGLTLLSEIDPALVTPLKGDPVRFSQVLLNLLSNAVKFTSRGRIKVFARQLENTRQTLTAEFLVSDQGCGIPPEELPFIFDRFRSISAGKQKEQEGAGIGLAITRQLIELQGGTISVSSTLNAGSVFRFTIRFEKERAAYAPAGHPTEEPHETPELRLRTPHILLVEDNKVNCELMKALFSKWKYEFAVAETGEEAIALALSRRFDLVLMDLKLPGIDGYEATKRIRSAPGQENLPIIALTAHAIEGEKEKCMRAGMTDYMSKPFEPDELRKMIGRQLRTPRPAPAPQRLTRKKTLKVTDMTYVAAFGESREMKEKIITLFIENAAVMLEEMEQHLAKNDLAALGAAVHKFKSGALTVLARERVRLISSLEKKCLEGDKAKAAALFEELKALTAAALEELKAELSQPEL